ncbi:MAG: hypothetical protein P4L55_02165 [Syntrophobacteraceae bacterium]|nr:hypothetical protein [Syntrophobacteraceae bacterium]
MNSLGQKVRTRWKRALPSLLCLVIALMIFSAYSNTFGSPPYLDDFHSFVNVKAFYLHSLSISDLLALSRTQFGWTRFLPDVTFALNDYFGGSRLIYFHAVNILIHLLAFFAVFWLARLVITAEVLFSSVRNPCSTGLDEAPGGPQTTKSPAALSALWSEGDDHSRSPEFFGYLSLCVAAIWALSPVQTSAVTYLVQRMASMQALFFTLSAACFIKARLLSKKKRRTAPVFYFLCALNGLCAGLSKENSATLPVVLAVIDIWFFDSAWIKKGLDSLRKTGWKLRVFASVALLSSFGFAFSTSLIRIFSRYSTRDFTLMQRLLTEARVVVWYMSLLLWPAPSRLSMQHDPRLSTSLFSPLTTLPAILFIAALVFLAVRFRKKFPVITFGIIWFFLNLVIESTIIPLELVFEHRLYLPSVGFYLAVVPLLALLLRKTAKGLPRVEYAKAVFSLLLVCASFFSIMTFLRNGTWKDTLTIHQDTMEKAPLDARANADYANTLCQFGMYDEALEYAQKALMLGEKENEADSLAQNAIVLALKGKGKTSEAIERAEKFVKADDFKGINIDSLPAVCANVAKDCILENRPKDAYKWAIRGIRYIQSSHDSSLYKRNFLETVMEELFSRYDAGEVDPALATAVAPYLPAQSTASRAHPSACGRPADSHDVLGFKSQGVCSVSSPGPARQPPQVLAAMVFDAHGEEGYARMMLQAQYEKHPNDPLVKARMANFQKEDAQNLAQKKYWDSFSKYVKSPFSRFNFDMAVAYLVQTNDLPKFFQRIGRNRLDAALKISPDSRDARLLNSWYLYNQNEAGKAAGDTEKLLAANPTDSNVWLARGFFLTKTGDNKGAEAAFKKVLELYPGYPHRPIVEELCSKLNMGNNVKSQTVSK